MLRHALAALIYLPVKLTERTGSVYFGFDLIQQSPEMLDQYASKLFVAHTVCHSPIVQPVTYLAQGAGQTQCFSWVAGL